MKKQKAFTLIELLVVIAIIGLLAGIALISVNDARKDARDAQRKADLNQIKLALDLFYDENDFYPSETWCDSSTGSCDDHGCPCDPLEDDWSASSQIHTALVGGGYIPKLPIDPINDENYYYDYEPDCNQGNCPSPAFCCFFRLRARLEQGGNYALEGY